MASRVVHWVLKPRAMMCDCGKRLRAFELTTFFVQERSNNFDSTTLDAARLLYRHSTVSDKISVCRTLLQLHSPLRGLASPPPSPTTHPPTHPPTPERHLLASCRADCVVSCLDGNRFVSPREVPPRFNNRDEKTDLPPPRSCFLDVNFFCHVPALQDGPRTRHHLALEAASISLSLSLLLSLSRCVAVFKSFF